MILEETLLKGKEWQWYKIAAVGQFPSFSYIYQEFLLRALSFPFWVGRSQSNAADVTEVLIVEVVVSEKGGEEFSSRFSKSRTVGSGRGDFLVSFMPGTDEH